MPEDDVLAADTLVDVDEPCTVGKGGIVDEEMAAVTDEAFDPIYEDAWETLAESNEEALPTRLTALLVGTVEKVVAVFITGRTVGDDEKPWFWSATVVDWDALLSSGAGAIGAGFTDEATEGPAY